jgi:hypothetical protein
MNKTIVCSFFLGSVLVYPTFYVYESTIFIKWCAITNHFGKNHTSRPGQEPGSNKIHPLASPTHRVTGLLSSLAFWTIRCYVIPVHCELPVERRRAL